MPTRKEVLDYLDQAFPTARGTQNEARASLVILLQQGENPNEMPVVKLGVTEQDGSWCICAYFNIPVNGKVVEKHICESVYLLVALGMGSCLSHLAELALRSGSTFHGVAIDHTPGAALWGELPRVVETAVTGWSAVIT